MVKDLIDVKTALRLNAIKSGIREFCRNNNLNGKYT